MKSGTMAEREYGTDLMCSSTGFLAWMGFTCSTWGESSELSTTVAAEGCAAREGGGGAGEEAGCDWKVWEKDVKEGERGGSVVGLMEGIARAFTAAAAAAVWEALGLGGGGRL
jgi:hypothetical protein